ncbi:MFS transporter [Aquipuribacter nitratireducens]|uniref:MFS transporter n=1 Tax=Aquipuribacter nitratireducens TaxID=650104 RepID=A0ABW0GK22_9MICO
MTGTVARETRPRGRLAVALLAVALLSVEFLAGMQRYLSQTVLPLVAEELDGRDLYGPLDAAAQAPLFLMMPIGVWLLARFRIGTLMLVFTAVTALGSLLCAAAPTMGVFIAGTAVRAFAAGALATIGLGAISRGLPPRYRQLVLAGMSGVWVVSSVLGPVYAVAVSSLLGWRWAMLMYLPLLLLARMLIARYVPERSDPSVAAEPAPWGWAVVLATGSAVLSLPVGVWSLAVAAVGAVLVVVATRALLPEGTLSATHGRRAGLSALLTVAATYFGATSVLTVVAVDAFGLTPGQFGVVIATSGFTWAALGLWTGTHPALADAPFRRRATAGAVGLGAGVTALAGTTFLATPTAAFVGLVVGAALLGAGMGTVYPDLLGRCFTPPDHDDGIDEDRMAGAVALAETVGLALATTLAFAWLGTGFGLVDDPVTRAQVLYVALLPVAAGAARRLVAASRG